MNLFYVVKIKYYEKIRIDSERLSDYSIIYTIKIMRIMLLRIKLQLH